MCGKKITGLVSWGVDTCGSQMPGVYVNVAFFSNWIDKVGTLIHIMLFIVSILFAIPTLQVVKKRKNS